MNNGELHINTPDTIDSEEFTEEDEVAEVLAALRTLTEKVSSPVVRACLDQAYDDIAHLTYCGDEDGEVESAHQRDA